MTPERLVTPCDTGSCIELRHNADGTLELTTTTPDSGTVTVTPGEILRFAAAVDDGYFDAYLRVNAILAP